MTTGAEVARRRRQWAGLLVLAAALVVYGSAIAMGRWADKFLLYPTTAPIAIRGATRLELPHGTGVLEIWSARTGEALRGAVPRAYVLAFSGNASRAEEVLAIAFEQWSAWPVEIWAVNYPGYGASSGPATLSAIGPAALAAFDALAVEARGAPIIVDGNSLGTTAALHVAAHRRCTGLVLQSPPPLRRMILQRFGWWNLWLAATPVALQVPGALDSIANARNVQAPAVVVTGEADALVPPKYQQYVVDAYAGPMRRILMRSKGHNDILSTREEREAFRAAVEWMLPQLAARAE